MPTNELVGASGAAGGLYDNQSTYSFNLAPEIVAKMAFQPGWGHWEFFGVGRFFHDRIYPTTGSPYNDSTVAGGVGGGFRAPLGTKNLTIGLKGLYGDGTGRMGSSTIEDATLRPDGTIAPLHTFSGISTVEANLGKRLMIYLNYGGDYVARRYFGPKRRLWFPYVTMTGCNTEPAPSGPNASSAHSSVQLRRQQQRRAGVQRRRLVQPLQRSQGPPALRAPVCSLRARSLVRPGGATNPDGGAKGIDNMFWTSFRYYVP